MLRGYQKTIDTLNSGINRLSKFYDTHNEAHPVLTNFGIGAALGGLMLAAHKVGLLDPVFDGVQKLTEFSDNLVDSSQAPLQPPLLTPSVEQFCQPDTLCNPLPASTAEQLIS